jgi:hypothetical protein
MSRAFVIPDTWRAVRLVLIRPAGLAHVSSVAEVMESLLFGFRALGIDADIAENTLRSNAVNIIFMAFYLHEDDIRQLPANTIIYNFEQMGVSGAFFDTPSFRTAVTRFRVWDYNLRNLERLGPIIGHGRRQVVPVGYAPILSRIPRAPVQDIDVLFYGSINQRRRDVLLGLRRAGLNLHHVFGAYGAERDALIARAKVVLNIQFYPTKILEVVRISYLLANRKAVVTELDDETEIEPDLRDAVAGVPYDRLVAECCRLVAEANERQILEDRGFAIFQQRDLVPRLRQAVTEADEFDRNVGVR